MWKNNFDYHTWNIILTRLKYILFYRSILLYPPNIRASEITDVLSALFLLLGYEITSISILKNKLQEKFSPWSLKFNQVLIRVDERTINWQINKICTLLLSVKSQNLIKWQQYFWMTAGWGWLWLCNTGSYFPLKHSTLQYVLLTEISCINHILKYNCSNFTWQLT